MGEYNEWLAKTKDASKYSIKYYKGLGTSTAKEAKEYFNNIRMHKIQFSYTGKADDEAIDLAFNKKLAEKRREWLASVDRSEYIDHSVKTITYNDFVYKELVHFSIED